MFMCITRCGCVCYYCILPVLPPDDSLIPHTLLHAVSTVKRFWGSGVDDGLLWCLGVPVPVIDQIKASQLYLSEDEKRMAGLQYCLQTVPDISWGRIAGVLWEMEEYTVLETVRQHLPPKHGEQYTEDDCVCVCIAIAYNIERAWELHNVYMYQYK